jgi:hypothetical protein
MKPTFTIKTSAAEPTVRPTVLPNPSAVLQGDDAPPLTAAHFKRAQYRVAGRAVSRETWQRAARASLGKRPVNVVLQAAKAAFV